MAISLWLSQTVAGFDLGPRHESMIATFLVTFCVSRGESSSPLETMKDIGTSMNAPSNLARDDALGKLLVASWGDGRSERHYKNQRTMTCNGGLESAIGQWLLIRSSPLMSDVTWAWRSNLFAQT